MKVVRVNAANKFVELDIPNLTSEQLADWIHGTRPIQEVLGHLSADEREFLLTGTLLCEWDELVSRIEPSNNKQTNDQ